MQILLLGTAAAEGWPAPFCLCPSCNEARKRGGPNIRTRSGALIDDDLKIDFCPDTVVQMQRSGRTLAHVKTILFTHQHNDHLAANELEWTTPPFTNTPPGRIEICGNRQVIAEIRRAFSTLPPQRMVFDLHEFTAGDRFRTATGDEVHALPADHVEGATVLRIGRKEKTIFYGHDSGLYPAATLDALSDGTQLDVALFDCTSGGIQSSNRGHMDISGVIQMVTALRERGAITPRTRVVATHFSHNGKLMHEDLIAALMPHGIEVAFDGMVLNF